MNIIEAMRVWRNDLPYGTGGQPEYIEAAKEIDGLLAAYDALAPKPEDWAAFPWAKWCTIDYQGRFFWECEPEVDGYRYWNRLAPKDGADYGLWNCDYLAPKPDVRVGLDWRDCKWMRPEEGKEVQP